MRTNPVAASWGDRPQPLGPFPELSFHGDAEKRPPAEY